MKVIFIGSSSMGPRYIMGALKKNGYQSIGIYQGVDDCLGEPSAGFEPPISLKKLIGESPEIIGFSIDSSSYRKSIRMAENIKAAMPKVFIIFGGVHSIIFPEEVITNTCVDALCLGEGEYPMLELCNAMHAGKDILQIQNLWVKDEKGIVYKNPMRPYVQDLDVLEMDRENLYYTGIFSGRGCKGNCAFCNTPAIKRAGSKGRFLRKRNVEGVLNEIETILRMNRKYALRRFIANPKELKWLYYLVVIIRRPTVRFKDDTFLADKDWFLGFARKFSRRFPRVSYMCNARADEIDEEVGEWLRRSRCEQIGIGFECGNEEYRNKILKKRISNADILRCADILKRNQIPILGQWMIGLPGETVQNVMESIKLSVKIGDIPQVHIAQPYPKTDMHKEAVKMGLIDENYIPDSGMYHDVVLHKGETRQVMKLLYNLFSLKDLQVPEDYEVFKHLGRLRQLANKRLGDILQDILN